MRKFLINVNGNSYEVEVEELGGAAAPQAPVTAAQAPQPTATPAAPKAAAPSAGEKVNSPMPGNILDIRVKEGDTVKEGDILMILEAMKMENEILAPCSGKVSSIAVSKGTSVGTGDLLAVIA